MLRLVQRISLMIEQVQQKLETTRSFLVRLAYLGALFFLMITDIALYAALVLFFHSTTSFQHLHALDTSGYRHSYAQHYQRQRLLRFSGLTSVALVILITVTTTLLATPQEAKGVSYTVSCNGTALTESTYTSNDSLVLEDGGDGICTLDTALTIGTLTIQTGVTLTHDLQDTDGVTVTATNVTVDSGGTISATEKGCYPNMASQGFGPDSSNACSNSGSGYGVYASPGGAGGGGHGGVGGAGSVAAGGTTYGDAVAPTRFGASGGGTGSPDTRGGIGGGLIRLTISNTLTNNGIITANGGNGNASGANASGGGAGGSLYITTSGNMNGTGNFSANGGNGADADNDGGGGGGGRISVTHNGGTTAYSSSTLTATGGTVTGSAVAGTKGTVYVKNSSTSAVNIYHGFTYTDTDHSVTTWTTDSSATNQYCATGSTTPSVAATTITLAGTLNCSSVALTTFAFSATTLNMSASAALSTQGDLSLSATSAFSLGSGANITLSGNGSDLDMTIPAGNDQTWTNATITLPAQAMFTIDDAIAITLAGTTAINAGVDWSNITALTIATDASINATGKGCASGSGAEGYGPNSSNVCTASTAGYGAGANGAAGAGHGGAGGAGTDVFGGTTYGTSTAPVLFGSSGGDASTYNGGNGGGVINILSTGNMTLNGAIRSNGGNGLGSGGAAAGGGSGGSIYLRIYGALSGSTGAVSANGGNGADYTADGGGGGGGRIALYYGTDSSSWFAGLSTSNAAGGTGGSSTGTNGSAGSYYSFQYTVPTTPTLSAPSALETGVSRQPTATTSAYASNGLTHTTTDYQISDNNTFSNADCSDTNIVWCKQDSTNKESIVVNSSNGTFQNALSGKTLLKSSTTYYLRTRHTNGAGDSAWSSSVTFTTTTNTAPSTPSNSAPSSAATSVSKTPTLTTTAFSDSNSDTHSSTDWLAYRSSDCSGTAAVSALASSSLTSYTVTTTLDAHTTYSFKARHADDQGNNLYSSYSTCTSFTTLNTTPTTTTISNQTLTEDTSVTALFDLDDFFADADSTDDPGLSWSAVDGLNSTLGTMTVNSNGKIDIALVANANGTDAVKFRATDGGGATVDSNAVTVTVTGVIDAPVANAGSDKTADEDDASVTLNATASSDADGDTLQYAWVETLDQSDGCSLTNTTSAQPTVAVANTDSNYSCEFRVTVSDAFSSVQDTVALNVTANNDAPELPELKDTTVTAGENVAFAVTVSDVDTSSVALSVRDSDGNFAAHSIDVAELFIDNNDNTGVFNWKTTAEHVGTFVAAIQASDASNTTVALVTITVEAGNVAPQFTKTVPNVATYAGHTTSTVFVLDNAVSDKDDEKGTLQYEANGQHTIDVEIDLTSAVTLNVPASFVGTEEIVFTVSDAAGASDTSNTVVVTVDENKPVEDIDHALGIGSGKGKITVRDSNGKKRHSWVAFPQGGVVPRLVTNQEETILFAMKKRPGSLVQVYTSQGALLKKQRFSKQLQYHQVATGQLDDDAQTIELATVAQRKKTLHVTAYTFDPAGQKQFALLARKKTSVQSVLEYTTRIRNRSLELINSAGDILLRWKSL